MASTFKTRKIKMTRATLSDRAIDQKKCGKNIFEESAKQSTL